jgi:hypothetical protein
VPGHPTNSGQVASLPHHRASTLSPGHSSAVAVKGG